MRHSTRCRTYYVCANANVQDTYGVAISGSCWNTYFETTSAATPDTTPGTVSAGPPNGSTGEGTNAYIRFQFSKPADRTTVNSTNIQITTGSNPIPGTWSYSLSGNDNTDVYGADFSPLNPLPTGITISIVTNNLLDYAGNTFAPTSTSFTTGALPDYSAPTVSLDFANGSTGIGTNTSFTCHYSEAVDPSSVNTSNTYIFSYVTNANIPFNSTWASDLTAVTMTPTSPLLTDSEYRYDCTGAVDLTGNGLTGSSSYFYTGNGPVTAGQYLSPPTRPTE